MLSGRVTVSQYSTACEHSSRTLRSAVSPAEQWRWQWDIACLSSLKEESWTSLPRLHFGVLQFSRSIILQMSHSAVCPLCCVPTMLCHLQASGDGSGLHALAWGGTPRLEAREHLPGPQVPFTGDKGEKEKEERRRRRRGREREGEGERGEGGWRGARGKGAREGRGRGGATGGSHLYAGGWPGSWIPPPPRAMTSAACISLVLTQPQPCSPRTMTTATTATSPPPPAAPSPPW